MTEENATYINRTFEPFKFMGRLTFIPLRIAKGTPLVTLTTTWEAEEPYRFAPTAVVKFGPLPFGLGVGWWRDSGGIPDAESANEEGEVDSEYDLYTAVNGYVDKEAFQEARREVASLGLDYDDEMAYLQERGLFQ